MPLNRWMQEVGGLLAQEKILLGSFSLLLVILLGYLGFSLVAMETLIDNSQRIAQGYQRVNALSKLLSTLQDAETGQRGYLLTGTPSYLEPYQTAITQINAQLRQLDELTAGHPEEQRLLSTLSLRIGSKLEELTQTIRLRQEQSLEAALPLVLSDQGKALMDEIRRLVADLEQQAHQARQQAKTDARTSARQAHVSAFLIGVLAIVMFVLFSFQVYRSLAIRTALLANEQQARAQAEAATQAEQEMRTAAETANHLKDEFLATVSHELRTPLNAMLGWVRLLRTGMLDSPTAARALETIERNAKSQAQLVEDLLDVSRIISGKLRLKVGPVQLAAVVEAAVEVARPAVQAKGLTLNTVLDSDTGLVSGDPERLQQVVWNLLANAVKFTPKGGRVEVRLEKINSHVEIVVSDTGQGIRADFLPHVFESFRQADTSLSRMHGGLGLGLAISRRLVELHGGLLSADSPGEGQGATFTVRLPLRGVRTVGADASTDSQPALLDVSSSAPFISQPILSNLRILVVDDQPDTLEMIAAVLSQCGAAVHTITTAREALAAVESWRPDLLIADIGMPVEDGYWLIRHLRALPPEQGRNLPAIALTAYARVEDRMKTLSAGYQMHVPKPVEPAELTTLVASLMGRTGKPVGEERPAGID